MDSITLIDRLANALASRGMRDLVLRTPRPCHQFYAVNPMIWQTAFAKSLARRDTQTFLATAKCRNRHGGNW